MQENYVKLFETIGTGWKWIEITRGYEMNGSEIKRKNVHRNKGKDKKMKGNGINGRKCKKLIDT